jgi:cytochrome c556
VKISAVLAGLVSVTFCAAGIAATHRSNDPIVLKRQASMKEMATAAKTISEMFSGRLAYDARAFKAAAETIRGRSGDTLIAEFPANSLGGPSAAKAEIEQSREEFGALARHLEMLATALSADADNAPAGITDEMRMGPGLATGGSILAKRSGVSAEADPSKIPAEHVLHLILQNCTSCHAKFREKVQ